MDKKKSWKLPTNLHITLMTSVLKFCDKLGYLSKGVWWQNSQSVTVRLCVLHTVIVSSLYVSLLVSPFFKTSPTFSLSVHLSATTAFQLCAAMLVLSTALTASNVHQDRGGHWWWLSQLQHLSVRDSRSAFCKKAYLTYNL